MYKRFGFLLILVIYFSLAWSGQSNQSPTPIDYQPFNVISSSANQLVVSFNYHDETIHLVQGLDGNQYSEVIAPAAGVPEIGMPATPIYSAWILIPNGMDAHVTDEQALGEPVRKGEDIQLIPVQPPRADLDGAPFGPFAYNEEVYNTDAYFPVGFARLDEPQMWRGQKCALLWIYPYKYNPVSGVLDLFHIQITISFTRPGMRPDEGPEPIPWRLQSDVFERMYRRMAINANEVLLAEKEATQEIVPYNPYGYDYIILTRTSFQSYAKQLAAWKQQQGFKVWVEAYSSTPSAATIKSALLGAYENWDIAPEYILILGDADAIPTFYKTWHPFNNTIYNGKKDTMGYTASDLYYSTLESSDPNNPDADLLADVLLGRMSVDTTLQAQARVAGSIHYEKSPTHDADFYDTALVAADFPDGDTYNVINNGVISTYTTSHNGIEDRRFTQTVEDIAIYLGDNEGKTINRQYYAGTGITPAKWNDSKQSPQEFINFAGDYTAVGGSLPPNLTSGFLWDGNATDITSAINNGAFLVVHRDHGARDHWGKPYYDYVDGFFLMNNPDKLPIIWSINCETGWFDEETDFKQKAGQSDWTSGESLSEGWERPYLGNFNLGHDYGAVGVVAATRVSYGGYNEYFTLGMGDAIWDGLIKIGGINGVGGETVMGAVLNLGKEYMYSKYQSVSTIVHKEFAKATMEGYHWFGDPSLEIHTSEPLDTLQLLDPDFSFLWDKLLLRLPYEVFVEFAPPGDAPDDAVEGARVTISNPAHPEQVWTAISDSEGKARFPGLLLQDPGEYDLTAWLANTVPISTTLTVQPGLSGGIGWEKWGYSCSEDARVLAADADLAGAGLLEVSLSSSAGDAVSLMLNEEQPGYFAGLIATDPGAPNPGDNVLQVQDGGEITATYNDADNGTGIPAVVSDTASIDCLHPAFLGLQTITGVCPAVLQWAPASDTNGPILYRIYRSQSPDDLDGSLIDTTWANYYPDPYCFQGAHFYRVRAVDRLGNEDENLEMRDIFVPGIFLPLIQR